MFARQSLLPAILLIAYYTREPWSLLITTVYTTVKLWLMEVCIKKLEFANVFRRCETISPIYLRLVGRFYSGLSKINVLIIVTWFQITGLFLGLQFFKDYWC